MQSTGGTKNDNIEWYNYLSDFWSNQNTNKTDIYSLGSVWQKQVVCRKIHIHQDVQLKSMEKFALFL